MRRGDYIVYVDESGDHNLKTINPASPIFVLALCIFPKDQYRTLAVPAAQSLKFDFWGHDGIVLHSYEIRKSQGDFSILLNGIVRARFMDRMNSLIEQLPMTVIASVINKPRHVARYVAPANPYEIALGFCIERLHRWLEEHGQLSKLTHLIVERRGMDPNTAEGARALDWRMLDLTIMPVETLDPLPPKNE